MFTRFGDLTDDLKFGFYLSAEPILDPSQSGVEKIFSTSIGDSSFTAVTSANLAAYYYTAFAESMEGIQFGTEKAFLLPRVNGGGEWTDGSPIENFDNWWESEWFGLYSSTYYPWIYHKNLGWVYVYHGTTNGAWLYHQNLGWMWTNPDSFPYLYVSKASQWSYLNLVLFKTTLYDFTEKQWFS